MSPTGHALHVGVVEDNTFDQFGCISVRVAAFGTTIKARVVTAMAGDGRGTVLLPEVGDQVLVVPVAGADVGWALLGSIWSRQHKPQESNTSGKNDVKVITTRGGNVIRLVDEDGKESIEIANKDGRTKVVIKKNELTVESGGSLTLKGESIRIEATSGDCVIKGGPKILLN